MMTAQIKKFPKRAPTVAQIRFAYVRLAYTTDLKGIELSVLQNLCLHVDGTGTARLSYTQMAKRFGWSRRTIIRAISSLEAKGYLKVETDFNDYGGKDVNRVILSMSGYDALSETRWCLSDTT